MAVTGVSRATLSAGCTRRRRLGRWAIPSAAVLAGLLAAPLAPAAACHGERPESVVDAVGGVVPDVRVGSPEISTPRIETMVDVGGRTLYSFVYGSGSPTVVLVSGLSSPQEYWNPVVPELAEKATVVTYDRAGVGRSEIGNRPTHGEASARDLHALLAGLGVPGPYILVGHSYGGHVARLFASMYPDDMGGLILEETQHEGVLEEMRRILTGEDLARFDEVLAPRFDAPEDPRTEEDYRSVTRQQVRSSRPLPRMPFVVLTCRDRARAMRPLFSERALEGIAALDSDLMSRLAASIPGGRQVLVEGSGHNIHVDKPEALITPVEEMIDEVRRRRDGSGTSLEGKR